METINHIESLFDKEGKVFAINSNEETEDEIIEGRQS